MLCPSCAAPVPDGARFCPACGQPILGRDERRVVTVLFADLVGFTGVSETMDPEHLKNLVDGCFQCLVADVASFGGQVDKFIGDAVVALFGAPVAHEDDAERAVRAALRMQQSLAEHTAGVGVSIRMRIGVNTGEVLVGALRAGGSTTAMGDVVNIAQRLESVAEPGQVLVGPATHAATREIVRYEHLGPITPRGREEPVEVWSAIEAIAPPGRRPRRRRAPLVGRSAELALLGRAVDIAVDRSRAQLLLLLGEAGVGKSRLAEETAYLAEANHDAAILEGRCVPYGEANVWWPLAEALRHGTGVGMDDPESVAADRCRRAVAALLDADPDGSEVGEVTEGVMHLLGYAGPLDEIEPSRARDAASRALQTFFEAYARVRPVVLVLSDLHWADDLVLELLDHVLAHVGTLPFVVVATARQSLEDRWVPRAGRHNCIVLNLDPLDRHAAAQLLSAMVESQVSDDLVQRLLDRSGGNPFFLEELAAFLAQEDCEQRLSEALPDSLRGLVAARLDSLPAAERAALEDAAVLGRSGPIRALLRLAEGRGPTDGRAELSGLVSRDLLAIEDDRWFFHAESVREVAYSTLTKASRARRHAAIAAVLEADDKLGRDERVEQVALHFGAAAELVAELGPVSGVPADVTRRAAEALSRAAIRAYRGDMPLPALRLTNRALGFLTPTTEKADIRRKLLLLRAWAYSGVRDLPAARRDVFEVLAEADAMGDDLARARAMTILGEIQEREGHLDESADTLSQAITLWRELGEREGLGEALRAMGRTQQFRRSYAEAEAVLHEAKEVFRSINDRRGEAWAVQNLAFLSFVQGQADLAEQRLHAAAETFKEIGDRAGLGWTMGLLAWVRYQQGRLDDAERLGMIGRRHASETGDRWAHGMMTVLLANLRLWTGRAGEAVEFAREAREEFKEIRDHFGEAQALVPMTRGLVALGRIADADKALEECASASAAFGQANMGYTVATNMAVHLGDPDRALAASSLCVPDPQESDQVLGYLDWMVGTGIAHLQAGQVDESLVLLESAVDINPDSAFALSGLALAEAAVGRVDDAIEHADAAIGRPGVTYLDRLAATAAKGLALTQVGRAGEAIATFDANRPVLEGSDDLLTTALAKLARAEVLDAVKEPGATAAAIDLRQQADDRLRALGVAATGWVTAFRLAAQGRGAPEAAPA